MILGIDN